MAFGTIKIPRNAGLYAMERRKELGLTKRELALRSGVSEKTIYSFELGEKPNMHLAKLLAIYNALGLTLDVGITEPQDIRSPGNPTPEELAASFLADLERSSHGADL